MTINFHILKNDLLKFKEFSENLNHLTMVNLTIPPWNCANHVKVMGITPQKTPEILSTLNPFVAIALTSKKGITLFPFSDILKPVHGYFFSEDIFGT